MKKALDHCDVLDELYEYIRLNGFSLIQYEKHWGKVLYFPPEKAVERRDSAKHYHMVGQIDGKYTIN